MPVSPAALRGSNWKREIDMIRIDSRAGLGRLGGLAAAALSLLAGSATMADAQTKPAAGRTGTLRCAVSPGVGAIVGQRALSCTFRSRRGSHEVYTGSLTKVGLNLGVTGRGVLVWGV